MGTGTHVGNAKYNRSIGQNILMASSVYQYDNGLFGEKGKTDGIRVIYSDDPVRASIDLFDKLANGGKYVEKVKKLKSFVVMYDGTFLTYRDNSTNGFPAIQISVNHSTNAGGMCSQKIHFEREDKI